MPSYAGMTVQQVYDAIYTTGYPSSIKTSAGVFAKTNTDMQDLLRTLASAYTTVVGKGWTGPASQAFQTALNSLIDYIRESHKPLADYGPELTVAEDALRGAQKEIVDYKAKYDAATNPDVAAWDKDAVKILVSLAGQYAEVAGNLKEIVDAPNKLKGNDKPEKDDPKDKKKEDDKKKDEPKKDEPKKDEPKKDEPKKDEPKKDEPKGGGGKDDPKKDDPKDGPPTKPEEPKQGLSDDKRDLPDAPIAENDDHEKGIDVNGNGKPDLRLSGVPMPGAKITEFEGRKGVDVDGDGKPDIGMDGELLNYKNLVQGADGVLGIDVDGDGKPDIGLSGQILPDAFSMIVTSDGVRGLDLNGDGIPELGMDRKPLHAADLITYEGVTGIDVDGDKKPDIGVNGEILKWAPIVMTADGVAGVDLNNDGKPDIALLGGESAPVKRGADAIYSPTLPSLAETTGGTVTPSSLNAVNLSGTPRVDQGIGDQQTVLTSLGGARLMASAVPGQPPVLPARAASLGSAASSGYGAPPGFGLPGHDSPDAFERHTVLVEAADAWHDSRGGPAALGRPRNDREETVDEFGI